MLVAPDARVRHHEAAEQRNRGDRPEEAALARSRIRVLLTSYSLPTLLWLVPVGLLVAVAEAAGDLVVGRPRRARAIVGAWIGNLVHFRQLRGSRARAQSRRRIHDRDLRELHVRTSARVGAWFGHHLHTDTRLRTIGDRSRTAVDAVSDGVRAPATVAFVVFLALVLFGSRHFVTSDVPSIGTLVSWPGIGDLFDAFGSAWRYTGVGSASAAPPALALMGALGTVFLGAVSMARTVLVVVAIPLGSFGAYRLVRRVVGLQGPAFASALAYGVNPVSRNAIAEGRLGPLMVYVTLPFVLAAVARISRLDDGESPPRRGRVLRLAVLVALATAWYPTAPALFLLAGLVLVVVAPLTGHVGRSVRALGILAAAGVGAVVLLFPWPLAYLGSPDAASFGFAFHPHLVLGEVLRFQTGPNGAGWAMWGLIGAAAVPLFTATGTRLAWAARGWMLALAGWAAVWVPARFAPARAVLAPEAPLTLAALGLAIALGIGVAVLVDGIRAFRFGWRQPAVLLGGVALLLPALGFVADTFDGRWHAPTSAWSEELSFTAMGSNRAEGQFRMLWIGDPAVLPLDPVTVAGGVGYSLSRNGVGDATELLRAPEHDADEVVDEAIDLSRVGRTNRLGRLLAPVGVRYVVLPRTQGPGGGARRRCRGHGQDARRARRPARPGAAALRVGIRPLREPRVVPLASVVTGPAADEVPVGSNYPLRAALSADLAGRAHPVLDGAPVPPGTVLFGEAYDVDWKIEDGSARSRHTEAFGLVNGFELGRRSTVSFAFGGQYQRWLLLAASVVIWLAVIVRWRRTRERTRPVGSPRSRRERAPPTTRSRRSSTRTRYWWSACERHRHTSPPPRLAGTNPAHRDRRAGGGGHRRPRLDRCDDLGGGGGRARGRAGRPRRGRVVRVLVLRRGDIDPRRTRRGDDRRCQPRRRRGDRDHLGTAGWRRQTGVASRHGGAARRVRGGRRRHPSDGGARGRGGGRRGAGGREPRAPWAGGRRRRAVRAWRSARLVLRERHDGEGRAAVPRGLQPVRRRRDHRRGLPDPRGRHRARRGAGARGAAQLARHDRGARLRAAAGPGCRARPCEERTRRGRTHAVVRRQSVRGCSRAAGDRGLAGGEPARTNMGAPRRSRRCGQVGLRAHADGRGRELR